jgi:hypothetical protein
MKVEPSHASVEDHAYEPRDPNQPWGLCSHCGLAEASHTTAVESYKASAPAARPLDGVALRVGECIHCDRVGVPCDGSCQHDVAEVPEDREPGEEPDTPREASATAEVAREPDEQVSSQEWTRLMRWALHASVERPAVFRAELDRLEAT